MEVLILEQHESDKAEQLQSAIAEAHANYLKWSQQCRTLEDQYREFINRLSEKYCIDTRFQFDAISSDFKYLVGSVAIQEERSA